MFEAVGGLVSVVGTVVGFVGGAAVFISRAKTAKKEVQDVLNLAQKLADKYGDIDDDAKRMRKELGEAVGAVKALIGQ